MVDTRGLGKPGGVTGKDGEEQMWSRKFENHVAACHTDAAIALEWATDQRDANTEEAIDDRF